MMYVYVVHRLLIRGAGAVTCTYHNATPAMAEGGYATPSNSNDRTEKKKELLIFPWRVSGEQGVSGIRPANPKSGERWKSKLVELE